MLVKVNLDIGASSGFIPDLLREGKARVVHCAADFFQTAGLKHTARRFGRASGVFVPLMANNETVGILAGQFQGECEQEELTLLSSLASEMAVALLARRLRIKSFRVSECA